MVPHTAWYGHGTTTDLQSLVSAALLRAILTFAEQLGEGQVAFLLFFSSSQQVRQIRCPDVHCCSGGGQMSLHRTHFNLV